MYFKYCEVASHFFLFSEDYKKELEFPKYRI